MNSKYRILRTMAVVFKVMAWVSLILGMIASVTFMIQFSLMSQQLGTNMPAVSLRYLKWYGCFLTLKDKRARAMRKLLGWSARPNNKLQKPREPGVSLTPSVFLCHKAGDADSGSLNERFWSISPNGIMLSCLLISLPAKIGSNSWPNRGKNYW